jgi:hypothetical protein
MLGKKRSMTDSRWTLASEQQREHSVIMLPRQCHFKVLMEPASTPYSPVVSVISSMVSCLWGRWSARSVPRRSSQY